MNILTTAALVPKTLLPFIKGKTNATESPE